MPCLDETEGRREGERVGWVREVCVCVEEGEVRGRGGGWEVEGGGGRAVCGGDGGGGCGGWGWCDVEGGRGGEGGNGWRGSGFKCPPKRTLDHALPTFPPSHHPTTTADNNHPRKHLINTRMIESHCHHCCKNTAVLSSSQTRECCPTLWP